ncbi:CDP-alcohol phosphatidyltransferase family protein [Pseudomonas fluorescens]|jgi:phosphatidylglycerophosphate synthase|uniref:CDP-alcohol phosphatidyltransferase family protein n=1 Tax=Pseudomonas fluorescens TaxID=294 RepID=UPI0005FB85E6|nr:CDP-alcohol phosphatidyltransferase family protein [Pseudomonas fluorescens]KJZ40327.1 CDP-diacylglycerol--glycerol-3-phosphate 3-phosphatidyltransferase [Pseudomonas fluorescens]
MDDNRRPIKTRSAGWAKRITDRLVKRDISPNQISVASIAFALAGALALNIDNGLIGSLLCAVGIQLRLLCNLFDGMVAIEGGKQSDIGSLYNEFPDRIADSLLIIGLGYAIGHVDLGWFAALAAALTAYVRVFGGSLGLKQTFMGPMAKQHRMAVMTAGLLLNAVETTVYGTHYVLLIALLIIAVGSAATCVTRTLAISRQLKGNLHVDQ